MTYQGAKASFTARNFRVSAQRSVGTVVLLPLSLGYTGYVYWTFRGKVRADSGYH
jgi:hypothetical protein